MQIVNRELSIRSAEVADAPFVVMRTVKERRIHLLVLIQILAHHASISFQKKCNNAICT